MTAWAEPHPSRAIPTKRGWPEKVCLETWQHLGRPIRNSKISSIFSFATVSALGQKVMPI